MPGWSQLKVATDAGHIIVTHSFENIIWCYARFESRLRDFLTTQIYGLIQLLPNCRSSCGLSVGWSCSLYGMSGNLAALRELLGCCLVSIKVFDNIGDYGNLEIKPIFSSAQFYRCPRIMLRHMISMSISYRDSISYQYLVDAVIRIVWTSIWNETYCVECLLGLVTILRTYRCRG